MCHHKKEVVSYPYTEDKKYAVKSMFVDMVELQTYKDKNDKLCLAFIRNISIEYYTEIFIIRMYNPDETLKHCLHITITRHILKDGVEHLSNNFVIKKIRLCTIPDESTECSNEALCDRFVPKLLNIKRLKT